MTIKKHKLYSEGREYIFATCNCNCLLNDAENIPLFVSISLHPREIVSNVTRARYARFASVIFYFRGNSQMIYRASPVDIGKLCMDATTT